MGNDDVEGFKDIESIIVGKGLCVGNGDMLGCLVDDGKFVTLLMSWVLFVLLVLLKSLVLGANDWKASLGDDVIVGNGDTVGV